MAGASERNRRIGRPLDGERAPAGGGAFSTPATQPSAVSGDEPAALAVDRLLEDHREWLLTVESAAHTAAGGWAGSSTTDRDGVVEGFEAALRETGAIRAAPTVIQDLAAAVDLELPADPVAGPPYVVVTGQGLVCRATGDNRRLVVEVPTFAVEAGPPTRYRLVEGSVEGLVRAEFRE